MTDNENRLLKLLFAVGAAVIFGLTAYAGFERLREAEASIEAYSEAAARLPAADIDSAEMDARIARLRDIMTAHPATKRSRSFSDFAQNVRSALAVYGLEAQQYQVVGPQGAEALEITLNCRTLAFLRFLKAASDGQRGWSIDYLAVRPVGGGETSAVTVRIGDAN